MESAGVARPRRGAGGCRARSRMAGFVVSRRMPRARLGPPLPPPEDSRLAPVVSWLRDKFRPPRRAKGPFWVFAQKAVARVAYLPLGGEPTAKGEDHHVLLEHQPRYPGWPSHQ